MDDTWFKMPEHATLVTESTMASTPMATSTYLTPLPILRLFSRLKSALVLSWGIWSRLFPASRARDAERLCGPAPVLFLFALVAMG